MIEIKMGEDEEKIREYRKICPELFGSPVEVQTKKEMPTRPNMPAPKKKRRTNALRRYINRLYRACLVNTLAAITLAVIYTETRSEAIYAAMYVCIANALMLWACSD